MIAAAVITGLLSLVSIGLGIYSLVEEEEQKELLEQQQDEQEEYYAEVAEDVRRKGASNINKLKVSGVQKIGALEYSASRSGVAMKGTAKDILDLTKENIAKDVDIMKADIEAQVKAAEQTGNTAYLNLQTQIYNTEATQIDTIGGLVNNTVSFTNTFVNFLDLI
jgi:hypothetical protein